MKRMSNTIINGGHNLNGDGPVWSGLAPTAILEQCGPHVSGTAAVTAAMQQYEQSDDSELDLEIVRVKYSLPNAPKGYCWYVIPSNSIVSRHPNEAQAELLQLNLERLHSRQKVEHLVMNPDGWDDLRRRIEEAERVGFRVTHHSFDPDPDVRSFGIVIMQREVGSDS